MEESELLSIVDSEMENAMGHPDGQISVERTRAWEYFSREKFGDEVEGCSSFVTSDVSDVIAGLMPSLLRIFTTADNLVDFTPRDQGDVAKALQESDSVHWAFFQQNPAFEFLWTWFFDALLSKLGIAKAFWDVRETVTIEPYQGLSEDEYQTLLADDELEVVEVSEREGEIVTELGPAEIGGQPTDSQEQGAQVLHPATVYDVVFRRTCSEGQVVVMNVPPEEYRISADARSLDPSKARMVGQEREVTRSELIDMGWTREEVDKLPHVGESEESNEELARYNTTEEREDTPLDRSQQKILVREVYLRVDFDDDGRSELRKIVTGGGELLENEEVDRQPFHILCPKPLPHKHFGTCPAEDVMDLQHLNSTLTRLGLDNLYHVNRPGTALNELMMGDNTIDDLLSTRVGSIKRFRGPLSEAFQPITIPYTAGSIFPMIEQVEKMKQSRTGVAQDGQGLTADALKNIQTSVMAQALDMSRMKIETIVRVFAETGIKSLFLHIHELMLKHQSDKRVVLLRNKWVEIDPRSWRTRRDLRVKIGLGIGTREQNLLHLESIYAKQKDVVEAGGLGRLVSEMNLYNTFAEFVRNANLANPDLYFTNPSTVPPATPEPSESEKVAGLQAQIAQLEAQLRVREQEIDRERNMLAHQRELQKIQLQREKHESEVILRMEDIKTRLTDLELKYGQNVPGSLV